MLTRAWLALARHAAEMPLFAAFTWAAIDLIGLATGRRRDDHDHAGK